MEKISVKGLAIGLGVMWAASVLFLGWAAIFGWGTAIVDAIGSVYIGFDASVIGGIVGAIWGFIDGAIGGAIIAVFYNAVVKKKK
jgi:hypothetical protein